MSERACGVRLHPAARLLRWMGRHAVGVCFLLIGVWLFRAVLAGADGISYDWQWYRVWRYLGRWTDGHFIPGPLLDGLGMTVRIALFGLALAVAAGLGAALLRLSPWPVARGMAHVYVGCLRNTPLLLQLFFVYFLFAPAIGVGPFGAAVLALGLFEGAYMAELFRAGLQSVPRAQWEAGISLGLGVWNTLRLVILPQAVRRMLPPLTSQLVSLIKDTSLVSAIAVADLTMQAQVLIADTFLAFEIWLIVAALYLALTLCVALPARWMERRYARLWAGEGEPSRKGFYLAPPPPSKAFGLWETARRAFPLRKRKVHRRRYEKVFCCVDAGGGLDPARSGAGEGRADVHDRRCGQARRAACRVFLVRAVGHAGQERRIRGL